jgi:hypothetical protein
MGFSLQTCFPAWMACSIDGFVGLHVGQVDQELEGDPGHQGLDVWVVVRNP